MNTIMPDASLATLLSWLSPVFPTGSFAYSSGLENAVSEGRIHDGETLALWLEAWLTNGRGRNELILLRAACHGEAVTDLAAFARASATGVEALTETCDQGDAFLDAASAWVDVSALPRPCPLPVAVGAVCALRNIDADTAALAYAHAFIVNQTQIAIRLGVFGQKGAAGLLARLEVPMNALVAETDGLTVDDYGAFSPFADIATLRHEAQHARMFRT